MIKSAAILFQRGGIVEGQDYNQILGIGQRFGFSGTYISGYMTDTGDFVGGDIALNNAIQAGQVPQDHTKLHPEDLWEKKEQDASY